MKKIDLTKTGGFPMKQKALAYLQDGHFEILKAIIGHFGLAATGNYIIFGCEILGTSIKPGMMYINGELCPFAGAVGDLTTLIAKIETTATAGFKNGTNPVVYYDYNAAVNSAGVALSSFITIPKVPELVNVATAWADITGKPNLVIDPAVAPQPTVLQRLLKLEEKNAVFQAGGGMVLWNKPAYLIPTNWQEVANWKGRIPVGVDDRIDATGQILNPEFAPTNAGQNDPGRIGGNKNKTLSITEIPPHSHEVPVFANGSASGNADGHPDNWIDNNRRVNTLETGGLPNGSTKEFSLLNPYRTVLFIEYIG